ncbi:MAG TPA: WD40 repeat domain-containing serine/threonine protein kinase [Planctomycetota bacterium]|nr:WD40 repeat domain-containing serine/threonine protein kinase [Planctomycetota bacterium]
MKIGPYDVQGVVGQGGIGVVYRCRSARGDVAVKVLHAHDRQRLERFERERRLLGSFTEKEGFVPLLDAGTAAEGPYLVMPLVPGGTLRARLERGALGVVETVRLGRALAAALGRAHERGIVHRDVKPENVLFTAAGEPLLADLGLAKHFTLDAPGASRSVSISQPGALRGTVGYMAPEQFEDAKSVGPEADVFALGSVLYECLAGRPAFAGDGLVEVFRDMERPTRPALRDVPRWLAAAVERALAFAPHERFANGAELEAALRGESRPRRPRRRVLAAALAAGALACAFAAVSWSRRPRAEATPEPPRPVATLNLARASIRLESEWGSRRLRHAERTVSVDVSPDGTKALSASDDGTAKVWDAATGDELRSLEYPDGRRIPLGGAAFLTDGLAVTEREWTIGLWDVTPAVPHLVHSIPLGGHVEHLAGAGDGRHALVTTRSEDVFGAVVWDVLEPRLVAQCAIAMPISSCALSRDAKRALFGGGDGRVELRELGANRVEALRSHPAPVVAVAFVDSTHVLSASVDGRVRVTDLETTRTIERAALGRSLHHAAVRSGRILVSVDRSLRLLDAQDLTEVAIVVDVHRWHSPEAVALSPDGRRALACLHWRLAAWNLETGQELATGEGHRECVSGLGLSADGKLLVSGSLDGTLAIAHVSSGGLRAEKLIDTPGPIAALAVSPRGDLAATSGAGHKLLGWDLLAGTLRYAAAPAKEDLGPVVALAFSSDGKRIVSGRHETRTVTVHRARDGELEQVLPAGPFPMGVAFSPDGSRILVGDETGLRVLGPGRASSTVSGEHTVGVSWSVDGRLMAAGVQPDAAVLADPATGRILRRLQGERGPIRAITLSRDGGRLLTVGMEGTLREWDTATGELLAENLDLARRSDAGVCVVAAPDDRTVFVGTCRGVVATFELVDR